MCRVQHLHAAQLELVGLVGDDLLQLDGELVHKLLHTPAGNGGGGRSAGRARGRARGMAREGEGRRGKAREGGEVGRESTRESTRDETRRNQTGEHEGEHEGRRRRGETMWAVPRRPWRVGGWHGQSRAYLPCEVEVTKPDVVEVRPDALGRWLGETEEARRAHDAFNPVLVPRRHRADLRHV